MAITKNNPSGTRVSVGVLVEAELFEEFDSSLPTANMGGWSREREGFQDIHEQGI